MRRFIPNILRLPVRRSAPPQGVLGAFFFRGGELNEERSVHRTYPWYLVIWLTGVDYFSTLGYQPGLALLAAGVLSVPSTAVLVGVTLLGAVPVYAQVARHSYAGQGSIAMLEHLFSGWTSKIFVLVLLGFAGTDFVITMTLSAADAARHAVANPYLRPHIGTATMSVTLGLLILLALVFLFGFREAISLAAAAAIPYLLLNLVVLGYGLADIATHPELFAEWRCALNARGDWTAIIVASALVFPKLALGLSGFETGVSVMPLVGPNGDAREEGAPVGRIRATRKLLLSAGLVMSCMLLLSSFVATLLIPEVDYREGGPASGRALAYLAHRMIGEKFGTIYDLSTILILWFAGASAMTGLLSLIPRYLPRFGMAPRWVAFRRPLVLVLLGINIVVTLVFHASVEAQGGAYATGVLVLMFSAAVAVSLALWQEARETRQANALLASLYFFGVSVVFAYTLIDNVIERPDGIIIASVFIFLLVMISGISRYLRSTEMRVTEVAFSDHDSEELWKSITGKKIHLVPHHYSTAEHRVEVAEKIRRIFRLEGPFVFLHVNLLDNRSEFLSSLVIAVRKEGEDFVIEAYGAAAIASSVAYLSELLDPKSILVGLTRRNLMKQALSFVLFGEGETGLMVYSILVRYWEWAQRESPRPLIFLMSE